MTRPKVNSESQKELDRVHDHFQSFDTEVKQMTLDQMNKAPVMETEDHTKMSQREINKYNAPVIKPLRQINSKEPFNETYRKEYERAVIWMCRIRRSYGFISLIIITISIFSFTKRII